MTVRNTLLRRCRVSRNLGFQTNLFPYKRLTPRQFEQFLKNFPIMPGNRFTQLLRTSSDTDLQMEFGKSIHQKYNSSISTTLQLFPSAEKISSRGCYGITQNVARYLQRRGSRAVAQIERLNDAKRKLSMLYGPLPPRKVGKDRETQWNRHLLMTLERRLDVILVRAGLFPTVYQARQHARHKHVTVNGQSPTSGSDLCEPGDIIRVDPRLRPNIAEFWMKQVRSHAGVDTRGPLSIPRALHLEVDLKTLTVIYLFPPQRILLPTLIDFDALIFKK